MTNPTDAMPETAERLASPPGLHEFGYLLTDAATIARGHA